MLTESIQTFQKNDIDTEEFQPFIYGLADPLLPSHIRYVGMAHVRATRPFMHARLARKGVRINPHLKNWILKLQSEGRDYSVLILERLPEGCSKELLGFVEKSYIKSLREIGHDLTNVSLGGDGGNTGPKSQETKEKIRQKLLGNTFRLGQKHSQEEKNKRNLAIRQYFINHPEAGKKSGATRTGIKQSQAACEKKSLRLKGNKRALGFKHSKESGIKKGISLQGNLNALGSTHSEKSRSKASESLKAYHANPDNKNAIEARKIKQSATMKALHLKKKQETQK